MVMTLKVHQAIRFAIKTHEIYQQQKRKGKVVSYITHPLTVGIILAKAGASDDVIAAGILHDTIEDSPKEKPVSQGMLEGRFGKTVAKIVADVSEKDKSLSWAERKLETLNHIKKFSHSSLLVKSADIISNVEELLDDYAKEGDKTFVRFNASKEKSLENYFKIIKAIIAKWPQTPLISDLRFLLKKLKQL
jgi:(p)ppGpp synthase/HD superfamily hydrolase